MDFLGFFKGNNHFSRIKINQTPPFKQGQPHGIPGSRVRPGSLWSAWWRGLLLASRVGSMVCWCGGVPCGLACGWGVSGGPHWIRADRLRSSRV
jgi:hypothetical protein